MRVTEVRIRKLCNTGRMRAIVSITIDDQFVIHDLRIIEGNSGLFVAMPSRRTPSGDFRDIAHPINSDMRSHIHDEVMEAYTKELEKVS